MLNIDKYKVSEDNLKFKCSLDDLDFKTTEDIEPLGGIIGQDRAVTSIEFGLKMKHKGYNIYSWSKWNRENQLCKISYKEKYKI